MNRVIHGDGQVILNVCGCGKVHFTYGPITLHFDRDEFLAFADEVSRASAHLRHLSDGRGPVLLPRQNGSPCH